MAGWVGVGVGVGEPGGGWDELGLWKFDMEA